MDIIQDNLVTSMFVIGLTLLVIEILVLGFSTFVLFFIGLAALISGALLFIGVLPDNLLTALLATAVLSGILAAVLWRPLQNMQQKTDYHKAQSDLIGVQFELSENLTKGKSVIWRYSGIDWQIKSELDIAAGSRVEVVDVDVGIMQVKAV